MCSHINTVYWIRADELTVDFPCACVCLAQIIMAHKYVNYWKMYWACKEKSYAYVLCKADREVTQVLTTFLGISFFFVGIQYCSTDICFCWLTQVSHYSISKVSFGWIIFQKFYYTPSLRTSPWHDDICLYYPIILFYPIIFIVLCINNLQTLSTTVIHKLSNYSL